MEGLEGSVGTVVGAVVEGGGPEGSVGTVVWTVVGIQDGPGRTSGDGWPVGEGQVPLGLPDIRNSAYALGVFQVRWVKAIRMSKVSRICNSVGP